MRKHMLIAVLVMVTFIAAIGFVKFRQVQAAIAQQAAFQPPPVAVTTLVAAQESWPAALSAIGTVEAVNGVVVSADLPGIVEKILFESGEAVQERVVLVELDTRQERAQLDSARARLELARLSLERVGGLLARGVSSQAEYDAAAAEHDQALASVEEMHAVIERKTIRAPFAGVLGIRRVNVGQYLTAGDAVVPLQSLDPIYVNFSVPQQQLADVRPGGEVRAAIEGPQRADFGGSITAVDSVVDPSTRNVQVQATFGNRAGRLQPGMFVTVQIVLADSEEVVAVPASAIGYAPYGDSVFVVEKLDGPGGGTSQGARRQFVRLGGARGDQVAVLSGLAPGDEIVTSGVFKLRNGAAVQVNNDIQPGNDPDPAPEDN